MLEDVRSLILLSKLYLYGTYMTQQVSKTPQLQKQSVGINGLNSIKILTMLSIRLHLLTQITAHGP